MQNTIEVCKRNKCNTISSSLFGRLPQKMYFQINTTLKMSSTLDGCQEHLKHPFIIAAFCSPCTDLYVFTNPN